MRSNLLFVPLSQTAWNSGNADDVSSAESFLSLDLNYLLNSAHNTNTKRCTKRLQMQGKWHYKRGLSVLHDITCNIWPELWKEIKALHGKKKNILNCGLNCTFLNEWQDHAYALTVGRGEGLSVFESKRGTQVLVVEGLSCLSMGVSPDESLACWNLLSN